MKYVIFFSLFATVACSRPNDECVIYNGKSLDYDTAVKLNYGFAADVNKGADIAKAIVSTDPSYHHVVSVICKSDMHDTYAVNSLKTFKTQLADISTHPETYSRDAFCNSMLGSSNTLDVLHPYCMCGYFANDFSHPAFPLCYRIPEWDDND